MTTETGDLHALIGSRICHDLISPLGAIGNGVELLTMSGITAAPEIALISESIENANARIRFFRVAFGSADNTSRIGHIDVSAILRDVFKGGRISVDWGIKTDLPRGEVKLAFLLIQCLECAMPWGGEIFVKRIGLDWSLRATAHRFRIDDDLWARLGSDAPSSSLAASEVQFALVPQTAKQIGRKVTTALEETMVAISF